MDRAASELGYTQPAISYQLKCLEQTLGVKLFSRDTDRLRLTREGSMIMPSVRAVLTILDSIKRLPTDHDQQALVGNLEWATQRLRHELGRPAA
jgi:DNA-binding transcriptional LysR family regulator